MKIYETLTELCQALPKYIGNGYKYYRITRIPPEKVSKTAQILKRLSNTYQTELTQGKRQYRRKKGLSNYSLFCYRDLVIILKTPGTEETENETDFKTFNGSLSLVISKYLTLILYRDERGVLTYRIERETFNRMRSMFEQSFKSKNGKKFHTLVKMFDNLPYYKGIGHQKKQLIRDFKEWQKEHKTKWKLTF
ncbi:MAG: hypothetical protein U9R50_05515 [Campylobacterota bacterium]|nr:hypothetical protein [Campylobacterota bacterium]